MSTAPVQEVLRIEYSGPSRHDADELASVLAEAASVPVNQAPNSKASMAIGEIVLTIAASAATKALVDIAIDKLRDYLRDKILATRSERNKAPNLKIILQGMGSKPIQRLISLRVATLEFAAEFVKNLGEDVAKSIA
jgi:hypothetical protein